MNPQPEDAQIRFHTGTYELFDFPDDGKIAELDLGCGVGSFTSALAKRYPERRILAADVMVGRLRKLARRNRRLEIENMTLFRVEARHLVSFMLPDGGLDRLHLLCPDPWPKDRHRAHRLLTADFCSQLHRVLKGNGIFHFSSDDDEYYEAVKALLETSQLFAEAPEALADIADLKTDFEQRWLEQGKRVRHLACRSLPLPAHTVGH